MAIDAKKGLNILKQFAVQWEHLHELALKAKEKTAMVSNEDDARYKQIRAKVLPIYSNMKAVFGRSVDPSEHAQNVLNRASSLKQILEMPEADKNILYHRFEVVTSNIYELGNELSPGGMGTKQEKSLPISAVVALEKGPKYSVSEEDIEDSKRRSRPRTFGAIWMRLMTDPVDFFSNPIEEHGIHKAVLFMFRLFLMISLVGLLCTIFIFRDTIISPGMEQIFRNLSQRYWEVVLYFAVWFAVYFVMTTLMLFLILPGSGWAHVCMKIIGGKGRYDHNYGVHCYTYAPHILTPLYLIFPVLVIVPILYQFILRVVGSAKVQKLSYFRALLGRLIVLIPYAAVIIIFSKFEYRDNWNAKVNSQTTVSWNEGGQGVIYFETLYKNQQVKIEKHLPDGTALITFMSQNREITTLISEQFLDYPKVGFYDFIRIETSHLPVRISQFSSRLNIRILGYKQDRVKR